MDSAQLPISPSVNQIDKPATSQLSDYTGSMWDTFEHVLLFISLGVLATNIALLLHHFVNIWIKVPTQLSDQYGLSYLEDVFLNTFIRGFMAAIIVSYPVFSFLFLKITKRTLENPNNRSLKARKVLIYITLIITFLLVLANIITLVYNLLGGNINLNFVSHFLVTVTIAGIIFGYYLEQIKEDRKIYA